ncbi:MAG: NlpC/P60 family protein [Cypionkella sp.]
MITHWAGRYLGTPWVAGESDCWNLARRIWREQFGRDVPAVIVDASSPFETRRMLRDGDRSRWQVTQTPMEGDAVMMARGTTPCHVGVYLADGSILHSVEGAGVICTAAEGLLRVGYQVAGFYAWRE